MNNRQVDLLNRLIQENEPVTGKVLAQQYLVSTKTIYNDISVINQYLKAFSSVIKKKPSMGIYIEIDEKYKNDLSNFNRIILKPAIEENRTLFENLKVERLKNGRVIKGYKFISSGW